jgi:hypothetical protein
VQQSVFQKRLKNGNWVKLTDLSKRTHADWKSARKSIVCVHEISIRDAVCCARRMSPEVATPKWTFALSQIASASKADQISPRIA